MERIAADPTLSADALALHFSRSDDPVRAWRYGCVAAERAGKSYANLDAARFYELAIEASHQLPELKPSDAVRVWTELGGVRELAGQFEAALRAYRRALELVDDDPIERAELLLKRARAKERAGRFSAALTDLSLGKRLLAQAADSTAARRTLAKLESFTAMVFVGQNRPAKALLAADNAIRVARQAGEREAELRALTLLEMAKMEVHGPGDGRLLAQALTIADELGDLNLQAGVRNNLGVLNLYAGRWNEAVAWLSSTRPLDIKRGDTLNDALTATTIGEIFVSQRRFEEADSLLQEALRNMRAVAFAEGIATVELQLARILLERGELERAASQAARVAQDFGRIGQPRYALEAELLHSDALCKAGNPTLALETLERAIATGAEVGFLAARIARVRGSILAALGRYAAAESEIHTGLEDASKRHLRHDEALLLMTRCEIAALQRLPPRPNDVDAYRALLEGLGVLPHRAPNFMSEGP